MTPSSGSVAGDDSITINGLGFGAASLDVTEVAIGDDTIGVSGIEYVDDTTIKVTTPVRPGTARTAGAELVTVKTSAGISTEQVLYTYRPLLQTANVQTGSASSTSGAATLEAAGYVLLNNGDDTYAVASMRKPITRTPTAPLTVSGVWSAGTAEDSGSAYSYATDVYLNPTTQAYGYESDERALETATVSTWTTTFATGQTHTVDGVTVSDALLMTSNGNCASAPNGSAGPRNTKDGYETYCSVFGPQIYSEPFYATQGQALSFSWSAKRVQDDYEIYAYLINVPSLDDTTTGITDDSVSVVAHSMGRNSPWTTSSAEIDDTGYYMFRFVNGTYDATGGLAVGSNMYISPDVIVGLANEITFPTPSNQTSSFSASVSATSGSATTVTSSTTSVCTVGTPSASAVAVTRVIADDTTGTCILTATQGAVGLYAPAQPVTITFEFVENSTPPAPTPTPVFPPSAPLSVVGLPGIGSAVVTWSPPASSGSFPVSTYQVVASPGGAGCLVTAPTLSCEVTGLTNGTPYTFRVRALNGAGWGPYSDPSVPITPGGDPPSPDPQPIPGPLDPGQSVLQVNGVVDPNVEVDPNSGDNGLVVTGEGWTMNLDGLGPDGNPLNLGPNGVLLLQSERDVQTDGTGFLPDSDVNLYIDPPSLVTGSVSAVSSQGIFIGSVRTNAQGSFKGSATLTTAIKPGDHVLQAVGLSPTGQSRALSLGVIVDPWIVLDQGTRSAAGRHDRIRTGGTTGGIETGTLLIPWIRYAGQSDFSQGKASIRVQSDGTFTWTRQIKKSKGLTAYVSYTDIESNRVFWAKVR